MTLSEIANFVCQTLNQQESNDIAFCKTSLQNRQKMVWNDQLWKDSLVQYVQAIPANPVYAVTDTWLPSKGILLLPPIIQRVVAVRTNNGRLNINRQEHYYRVQYDAFNNSGTPTDFVLLSPCVWEFDSAIPLYAHRANSADAGLSLVSDLLDSNGTQVTRYTTVLTNDPTSVATTERIDSMLKPVSQGTVGLGGTTTVEVTGAGTSAANGTYVLDSGTGFYINTTNGNYIDPTPLNTIMYDASNDTILYRNNSLIGTWIEQVLGDLPLPTVQYSNYVQMSASTTSQPKRQRIRLVVKPGTSSNFTIRVLGKRECPQFTNDNDEPAINGSENLLITLAHADMLQRERQYAKSSQKFAEAEALLDQLKRLEVVQQAHNSRIIPESGYGTDYSLNPGFTG